MRFKFALSLALMLGLSQLAFGQAEPIVREVMNIPVGSTKLESFMDLREKFPEYRVVGSQALFIDAVAGRTPKDSSVRIEGVYFINDEARLLIQLFYANDRLFSKSASWYYNPDQLEAIKAKHKRLDGTIVSHPTLLNKTGGVVNGQEEKHETGVRTVYPIAQVSGQEWIVDSGYEVIYARGSSVNLLGYWVYFDGANTIGTPLGHIPTNLPLRPNATWTELEQALTGASASSTR